MADKRCLVCGTGKLKRETKTTSFEYKNNSFELEQPGAWCSQCGEAVLNRSDIEFTRATIYDLKAKVDGFLTTKDIRRIRKSLGLTQREAGRIFGGGSEAFSRYEIGKTRPAQSTIHLLKLLDKHPELLREIKINMKKIRAA